MTRGTRLGALGLVVVLGCAAAVWAYRTGRIVHVAAPTNRMTLYGNIEVRQVELGFRVAGRLKTMAFEEGQPVTAGTVLATLDTRPFEDELRIANADVASAAANLKKLIAGNRPPEIARAEAAVAEASAAQRNASVNLERSERLVDAGALSRSQYDDAVASSRMADARLASANDTYRLLLQGSRSEDIAAGRAGLQSAEARVAAAETALADAVLTSPSEGVVLSRVREPGAIVSPNDVVYVVSLTRSTWARAYIPESLLPKVRLGMKVEILSDEVPPRPIQGHVGFVSPVAEFTPKSVETPELRTDLVYRIRIIVDDAASGLQQGLPVTVCIDPGGKT
jgi:HlyD family secretion protein